MKCTVYKSNQDYRTAELTHAECVALSRLVEVAAVVSHEETMRGNLPVYIDGIATQYDPVEGELVGAHDEFSGRNGWIS